MFLPLFLCTELKGRELLAPIETPLIAFYADFLKINPLDKQMAESLEFWANKMNKSKNSIDELLNKTARSKSFDVQSAFVYFGNAQDFVIILEGNFNMDMLSEMIGYNRVTTQESRIVSHVDLDLLKDERLYLEISPNRILACPENKAGNISYNLKAAEVVLDTKFDTFKRLFRIDPHMLLEVSLETALKPVLPEELGSFKHLRLAISQKIVRMQLSHDGFEEDELNETMDGFISFLDEVSELSEAEQKISLRAQGSSLFFVGEMPSKAFADAVLYRMYTFFLHFFLEKNLDEAEEFETEGARSSFAN